MSKLTKAQRRERAINGKDFYRVRSMLGYWWAIFLFLLGGREAGKSYDVTNTYVRQWRMYKRPFYWMRLTEASTRKLLNNNAEKLIDPDIRREYNLDTVTNGENVYEVIERDENNKIVKKELMARVLALSTFYSDKGSGLFDKNFLDDPNMYYNICLDEMNREKNEKNSFDIVYSFVNQLENLIRSTKKRVRVICIGNTLEEASDLLCAFDFLPEDFGRFKLVKNKAKLIKYLLELQKPEKEQNKELIKELEKLDYGKRAVIEYIAPGEKYLNRRHGTIADILMRDASTFTNKIDTDTTLITKNRLKKPQYIIKFSKTTSYTVWDNNIVCPYNGEVGKAEILMRPYLDGKYSLEMRNQIIELFDSRCFLFRNLITFKKFQHELMLLKPRK